MRCLNDAPAISFQDEQGHNASLPGIAGSASVKDGLLTLSLVNASAAEACEVAIQLRGGSAAGASATVLAADDIHACNTFEQPDAVVPRPGSVRTEGGDSLYLQMPAASIVVIRAQLG